MGTTREQRLAQFTSGTVPQTDSPMQLLCEDNSGTYAVPYVCHWSDGSWHNSKTGAVIQADVVGWREWIDPAAS